MCPFIGSTKGHWCESCGFQVSPPHPTCLLWYKGNSTSCSSGSVSLARMVTPALMGTAGGGTVACSSVRPWSCTLARVQPLGVRTSGAQSCRHEKHKCGAWEWWWVGRTTLASPLWGPDPELPGSPQTTFSSLAGLCTLVSPCLLTQCPLDQFRFLRLPLSSCHQVPGFLPHWCQPAWKGELQPSRSSGSSD